ncbi:MAG TPA: CrcB family protein [Pseudolysinimonas sp.]
MNAALVAAVLGAGAVGALLRYAVSHWAARRRAPGASGTFPQAVLLVNAVGSLVGGIVIGALQAGSITADARLIALTGFAGGLTTFSTFSVETIQLAMDGKARTAVLSVLANLALGVALAVLGYAAALGAL